MKRGSCAPRFVSACSVALFLLSPCGLWAADDEEREGTREQVEAEDNVTLHVTDGVAQDGEKELIVFDKDKPDEEWEVSVRVKFHPIPEHEYIIQSKKYNWKVSEGFVVDDPEAARPKIRAKAEAAGTEGRLNLHLQWQEEKLDEKNQPTGETKMHPWSNDKGSMRLLVPEFELESVSYNLGDGGKSGALPFYDNSDKPQPILAPEYVKGDTRSAENVGILYKKGITPKMKARFAIRPTTAGDIVLYADQAGLVPKAQNEENQIISGTVKEVLLTCDSALPNKVCSGTAEHIWEWSVYGRRLKPKDNQERDEDGKPGAIKSKIINTFIILNEPYKKIQEPWINCMKYGIEKLRAEGACTNKEVMQRIVPNFRLSTCYPPKEEKGNHQLMYGMDSYEYQTCENINHLLKDNAFVNCYDSGVSTYVISQYLGCLPKDNQVYESIDVEIKDPWWRRSIDEDTEFDTDRNGINWTKTWHTYLIFGKRYVFDPTPVWANTPSTNGPAQYGTLTPVKYFEYMNVRHDLDSYWRRGKIITPNLRW